MEWLITNAVAAWLLPPGFVLAALFAGWLLMWRRPRLARVLVGVSLIVLYALSTSFVSYQLMHWLEAGPRDPVADKSGQAIVVLGGGVQADAPEYGADAPTEHTLSRLRYGAHLHRVLGKPVLVTGGVILDRKPEALAMKAVLENEFQTPVQWVERGSRNTLENARLSYAMLHAAGIRKVYLVTQAWHMPRARLAFEHAGFEVIPAPTGHSKRERTLLEFMPSADALLASSRAFHEAIGIGWYHLRFFLGR